METRVLKRIEFLGVPVDQCDLETVLQAAERYLTDGGMHQVVFLDRRMLFRARRNAEVHRCLSEASLVLPVSPSIVRGARFLGLGSLQRFSAYDLIIRLLELIERRRRNVYLLGARKPELEKAERNLKDSFPGMLVVGRYSGYYPRAMEQNIVMAIRKASPSLLLASDGVPDRDLWILRHKRFFNPGIFLWEGTCLNIFAGKIKRPSGRPARVGREGLVDVHRKPWRLLRVFPLMGFWTLVLLRKIFRRG